MSGAAELGVNPELEPQIKFAELGLRIIDPVDRLQEAMLLVDGPFLHGATIADPDNDHVERAFGHAEWLGHLNARQLTRSYGKQPLTLEFMLDIHAAYARAVDTAQAGILLSEGSYISGSSVDRTLGYVAMTDTSIAAVRANPFVSFKPAPERDAARGWLVYGTGMNGRLRRKALQQICNWYNQSEQAYEDRVLLAAQLQRRVVSLHPFPACINGRPSRALMNWSLENSNLPQSSPYDFDDDVIVDLWQWRSKVLDGMQRYKRFGQRSLSGRTNPAELFGILPELHYFQEVMRHRMATPDPLIPGAHHDRNAYMHFMDVLHRSARQSSALSLPFFTQKSIY